MTWQGRIPSRHDKMFISGRAEVVVLEPGSLLRSSGIALRCVYRVDLTVSSNINDRKDQSSLTAAESQTWMISERSQRCPKQDSGKRTRDRDFLINRPLLLGSSASHSIQSSTFLNCDFLDAFAPALPSPLRSAGASAHQCPPRPELRASSLRRLVIGSSWVWREGCTLHRRIRKGRGGRRRRCMS